MQHVHCDSWDQFTWSRRSLSEFQLLKWLNDLIDDMRGSPSYKSSVVKEASSFAALANLLIPYVWYHVTPKVKQPAARLATTQTTFTGLIGCQQSICLTYTYADFWGLLDQHVIVKKEQNPTYLQTEQLLHLWDRNYTHMECMILECWCRGTAMPWECAYYGQECRFTRALIQSGSSNKPIIVGIILFPPLRA